MARCIYYERCPFFNSWLKNMPVHANLFRMTYCEGKYDKCARYIVRQATGVSHPTLMPNDLNRVGEIIHEIETSGIGDHARS